MLEKRWRTALKNKMISQESLDAGETKLDLTTANLGEDDKLRTINNADDRFDHYFEEGSAEYFQWLQATGTM